jgi:hypothetical protein
MVFELAGTCGQLFFHFGSSTHGLREKNPLKKVFIFPLLKALYDSPELAYSNFQAH